jgi:hypothetical protein
LLDTLQKAVFDLAPPVAPRRRRMAGRFRRGNAGMNAA